MFVDVFLTKTVKIGGKTGECKENQRLIVAGRYGVHPEPGKIMVGRCRAI